MEQIDALLILVPLRLPFQCLGDDLDTFVLTVSTMTKDAFYKEFPNVMG